MAQRKLTINIAPHSGKIWVTDETCGRQVAWFADESDARLFMAAAGTGKADAVAVCPMCGCHFVIEATEG